MRRPRIRTTVAIMIATLVIGTCLDHPSPAQVDAPADPAATGADSQVLGGNRAYSLVVTPAQRVNAEMTYQLEMPRLAAKEWVVYAAQLPVLPGQTGVSSTLLPDGQPGRELSPERQAVLRARIPAKTPELAHGLDLRLEYQATLLARRLVRVPERQAKKAPSKASAPPQISPDERRSALASGGLFDFNSEGFRHWLDDRKLRRKPEEGEIDFARRAFLAIKEDFTYAFQNGMDRHASQTCKVARSDCGGLSVVFASALRANRIPARILVGRWAQSSTLVEGKVFDQQHAKAEFFAQGVGWVPVDVSSAILHDRTREGVTFFGNDEGDFLTMHLDTDLVCDTIHFGRKTVDWLQAPRYWINGSGSFDNAVTRESWKVTASPAPELVEATLKKAAPGANRPKRARGRTPK